MSGWDGLYERYFAEGPARSRAVTAVRNYHEVDPAGSPRYTGSMFTAWAGGGDRPEVANVVTADDLVAVGFLSMKVHWRTSWEVLQGRANQISGLLTQIPTDMALADARDDVMRAANDLHALVRQIPYAGPTFTSNLLARKRPRLLPVYDSVVASVVGDKLWEPMRSWLRDGHHVNALDEIGREADQLDLSPLRVFDIVIWMAERDPSREPDDVEA